MSSKANKGDKAIASNKIIVDNDPGSYKWIIVVAYGTANVLIIPVLTSFGLIFKDKFQLLNFSALEATMILNLNSALGMTLGLFNGVLLNKFGYRKVAILGGILFSSGIMATAFAETFQHFLITYSIIASIGMGLCSSSFSLAINTYFKDDRNRAFGLGATITGLGPIFLPHLITFLLRVYDTQGCVLIIGALAMNIIVAALLLRPIEDFKKNDEIPRSSIENGSLYKPTPSISAANTPELNSLLTLTDSEYVETCPIYHDVDTQSIYGFEIVLHPMRKSEEIIWKDLDYKFQLKPQIKHSVSDHHITRRRASSGDAGIEFLPLQQPQAKRWFESGSVASVNLGSSMKIFHEDERMGNLRKSHSKLRMFDERGFFGRKSSQIKLNLMHRRNTVGVIPEDDLLKENTYQKQSITFSSVHSQESRKRCSCLQPLHNGWKRFVKVFDLGLLTDKIYLNIMIGIAIAIFSEINFSLLVPFILKEFQYTTQQTATFMSTLATVDIFCRFTSPFVGEYFHQPARIMYMYALLMLIIMRTSLLFAKTYYGILFVALGMGLAKGVRQVYMSCIVPSYIPLDRLAAASGIQMVANGVILLSMGSSVGMFYDLFGSYAICIIFINAITFVTLLLWTVELVCMKVKNSKIAKENEQNQVPELCKFNIEVN